MRTSNPAFGRNAFTQWGYAYPYETDDRMTFEGTMNRTGTLLVMAVFTAALCWYVVQYNVVYGYGLMLLGIIMGLIFAIVTIFRKQWSPYTAPMYALFEGLVLGAISYLFELVFPGIMLQAVGLTFGVLVMMLLIYRSGLIPVTNKFRVGVVAATGAIFGIYMVTILLGFFGIGLPYIHGSGPIGIGFSLFVVAIAALNLILDFDLIEKGTRSGAPKYMEWYGAFALMVTLIWLYIEILRLLAKARSN